MKRFTVTFEVEDEAPSPEIFCDAMKAVWAKGDANMIGGAAVVNVTAPVPSASAPPNPEQGSNA